MKGKTISRITAGILSVVCTTSGILSPQTVEMFSDTVLHVEGDSQPSDYYDIYGSILNQTAYVDAMDMTGTICDYALCDYDSDGIQECIALVDLGAGQVGLFYQLYDYQNGQVIKVDEIGGGYESLNEWYLAKDGNDIVIVGYQIPTYFYHLWTANGVTLLDAIDDGEIEQYEQLHTQYCGTSISFYSASDIGKLKSIAFQDSTGISALPTSGKCGENAEWSLDEATGTLTISGSGAIYDYGLWAYEENAAPWFSQSDPSGMNIRHIVIQEGITRIGECSFFGTAVTSVMLPESLQAIGGLAFHDCTSLKKITIPKSVSEIGSDALGLYGNGDPVIIEGFTVYGYAASAAQQYVVEQNSYPFVQGEMTFVALDAEGFEEIPVSSPEQEDYKVYFSNAHMTNPFEEDKLWYSSYMDASNPLGQGFKLLKYDAQEGALYSSRMLDLENDIFDLKFFEKDFADSPVEPKAYYSIILAQFIADNYSEEELSALAANKLADITEQLFQNCDSAEVVKKYNEVVSNNSTSLNTISSVTEIIDTMSSIKDTTGILEGISKVGTVAAGFELAKEFLDDALEHGTNMTEALRNAVYYQAFCQSNENIKFVFQKMRENTEDSVLKEVLDNYINVLDKEDCAGYIRDVIQEINKQESIEMAVDTVFDVAEVIAGFIIDDALMEGAIACPYLLIPIGIKFVVKMEDVVADEVIDTENLYENVSRMIACYTIHTALYNSYYETYPAFEQNPSFESAQKVHTILQCYQAVDLMAIEATKEYVPRFLKNNAIMQLVGTVYQVNFSNKVSGILDCKFNEVFAEIQQLISGFDTLEENYISISCCMSEEKWDNYVKALQYISGIPEKVITNAVRITKDEVENWVEQKRTSLEKWYANTMDVILIGCPVTVNIYNTENQLIAHLSDDGSEVDTIYQQFFFTFTETNDEWEEGKTDYSIESTKAKMLILPHDTTEYRYEILGDSNGEMDILSYYVEDYFNSNWFDSNCINFSFEDIEVTNTSSFVIEKDDETYSLLNQSGANNTSEIVLSTETTSNSPKSMLILWIVIAGTIMGVSAYFYQKRSKNR